MRLMTPPLPAASRPSKMMTIRAPEAFTQACRCASSTCRRASSFVGAVARLPVSSASASARPALRSSCLGLRAFGAVALSVFLFIGSSLTSCVTTAIGTVGARRRSSAKGAQRVLEVLEDHRGADLVEHAGALEQGLRLGVQLGDAERDAAPGEVGADLLEHGGAGAVDLDDGARVEHEPARVGRQLVGDGGQAAPARGRR